MDIRQLQTFIVVARLLNFRAAAEELNYSQSTVSDHIRNLEQELDVKLFERLGRKVFLNEQGKKLISSAERMIKDAEEIHKLFDNDEKVKGSLKIGAAETLCVFWLPPLLKEYSKIYPDVQIILKMAECPEFPEMLEKNIIDVAFGLHDESGQQHLSQIDLFQDSAIFVAAPDHPLTALKKITAYELENQSFILTEAKSGYSFELKKLLQNLNVKSNTIMEFGSLEAIKQCVKNGLGITLLPSIAVDKEIQRGELVMLPVDIDRIFINARMIYHREKWMSAPLEALKNIVLLKK
ncbi:MULTISPECIES: LysR family transcriptional regulator [unclassified Clostridium]|uniref:LysR family transcriptional regulator n=1 Tax=unclassified Clostridium TaxID=2614128 RepID=UPI0002975971|nr:MULTISPECIES: LysR family transcriptional regulator [unclassified Clostridium]EKQ56705.1 MAG: transcriptional regulator [Clostridium sp. Maddingley MBC34-26]